MGKFLGKGQIDSIVGFYVPCVPSGTQSLGYFIFLVLTFFMEPQLWQNSFLDILKQIICQQISVINLAK